MLARIKLNGFTLSELLISLILSSLVLLSCFSLYFLSAKTGFKLSLSLTQKSKYINFLANLDEDFESANYVRCSDGIVYFYFSNDSIKYDFLQTSEVVKSKGIVSDTILLPDLQINFFFNNTDVSSGIINKIKLSYKFNNEPVEFYLVKHYDAYTLLKFYKTQLSNSQITQ